MKKFHFACPGEIFFGKNCVLEHRSVFPQLGGRAYIISSKFPDGIRNLALEDVKSALEQEHITYVTDDEVQLDPSVESAAEMVSRVMSFRPDFLIAVGGGSTMDTAKSVNILMRYPNDNPYDVLFGKGPHVFGVGGPNEGALPFVSIATTAGTGADITGIAVMTRNDIQSKSGTNRRNFADYIFVDSRYVAGSPMKLNHATAIDALCHGIEAYLSRGSRDDFMTNMLSETAFRLFAKFKDHLLANTMSEEDYDNQALHSMLQGIVIVNEVTGVPHGLGYPLSYHYHVPHGLACGVFEGEYLRVFSDQTKVQQVIDLMGFDSVDAFCGYIQAILTPHINIQVTREQIREWTKTFCGTQWRIERHPETLTENMVFRIYERALEKYITD